MEIATGTDTTGTERMRITSGGDVCIGTTTPSSNNNYGTGDLNVENNTFASAQIFSHSSTVGNYSFLGLGKSSGTGASPTIVVAQETVASIGYYGYDGSGYKRLASIDGVVDGTPGAGDMPGRLTFLTTADGASTPTERMRISSDGSVYIGTPNGSSGIGSWFEFAGSGRRVLNLANSSTSGLTVQRFINGNGTVGAITTSGTATAYGTSSDYRLKEDLQDFAGIDMVSKIPVYNFKWKTDESRSYGVMAHELQEVLPQAVSGDKDAEEMQSVDYSKIVPLLVKSIQELTAKVDKLEQECKCKN